MKQLLMVSLLMGLLTLTLGLYRKLRPENSSPKSYYIVWILISFRLIFFMDLSLGLPETRPSLELNKGPAFYLEEKLADPLINSTSDQSSSRGESGFLQLLLQALRAKIFTIWLLGFMAYLLLNLAVYLRFRTSIKSSGIIEDRKLIEDFLKIKKDLGITRPVELRSSEEVGSPLVLGIFKPYLLLPSNYKERDLNYVISHELFHIKYWDLAYKLLIFIARAIHWFNPTTRLLANLANEDIEMLRDGNVIDYWGRDSKKAYSLKLLDSIENSSPSLLTTNYGGGKELMKKRIDHIFSRINLKSNRKVIALALSFILASSLLIGCKEKKIEEKSLYDYRTEYLGDNSKLTSIVDAMDYGGVLTRDSLEIQSKEEPYGLKVIFKEDFTSRELGFLKLDAAKTFSLVSNLSYIEYMDKNQKLIDFKREDIDSFTKEILNMTTAELGASPEAFQKLAGLKADRLNLSSSQDEFSDYQHFSNREENLVYDVYYADELNKGLPINKDQFKAMALKVLGSYESEDRLEVYSQIRLDQVRGQNGDYKNESSSMLVNLLVFEKLDKYKYVLREKYELEEGSTYEKSIDKIVKDHPEMKKKLMEASPDYLNLQIKEEIEKILKENNISNYSLDNYK